MVVVSEGDGVVAPATMASLAAAEVGVAVVGKGQAQGGDGDGVL